MDENLVPFKNEFYKECNTINIFLNLLGEIQTQIEFFGYICEKDIKIILERAEYGLKYLKIFKTNLELYKDEPSNLFLIEKKLIKYVYIYYSIFKNTNQGFVTTIKKNIEPITQNIKNTKKNILSHSISMLKQITQTKNRKDLNKYMVETLELMMINTFKSLFNFYQLILIFSKKKNDMYQKIKTKTEEIFKSEEVNIIINEISERSFAQKYKINYESLHFGNNLYKELFSDDNYEAVKLSKSYLNYTLVFIKCIQIRKKLIKELRIYFDVFQRKEKEQVDKLKKVCEKITLQTKSLSYSSQGIINSWNLIFSSWNSIYTNIVNYLQFFEEIFNPKVIKIINECNEEYKTFEKRWEKYSSKINEFRKNYSELSKLGKKPEAISDKKKCEEQLKNYLSIDCTDFLDNNIPLLRENEIKRANDIKDLIDKIISNTMDRFELYLENSEKEYDNAASIDLFEEVQNIFESQFEFCEIKDTNNFLENLKEKIEKIDFDDKLADNARLSLAEYYEHNDFDEGFDFTQGEIDNPFGPAVKENEEKEISFNEDKNMIKSKIGKANEEEISSIPFNEKNNEMINLNLKNNNITPSFHMKDSGNENNINIKNFEENDLVSDINIINNLNDKFNEQINKKISKNNNIQKIIDIDEEIEDKYESNTKNEIIGNKSTNNIDNNIDEEKDNNKNNDNFNLDEQNDKNNINEKYEKNDVNKVIKPENKDKINQIKDKQTVYYGILGILGLFCLKSLFSSNNIISIDSLLNIIILGIIFFVLYKTQFQ